jgi:TENA/THI-4/PQQC family
VPQAYSSFPWDESDPGLLWAGNGGYLRPSVKVRRDQKSWRLRHSIWELEIPVSATDSNPDLRAFLEGKRSARDINFVHQGEQNLVRLLFAQGCTTIDGTRSSYSMDEVRHVVQAQSAYWYGVYFSHPFWIQLRECRLSLAQLFAWILRTYHLSRSAGPTAARGAISSPNHVIRDVFLKSAVEEYSHCEIYYKPVHDRFGLKKDWVTKLLPLPSSLAFDQHMSVIAEDDWLAHTVSAYFQEYTAGFRENAFALYDRLEAAYGLEGFFQGWKDHIGYDVDQTHADDFLKLIAGSERVYKDDLLRSIRAASSTVEFLIGSLDELILIGADVDLKTFRVSPALLAEEAVNTTVLGGAALAMPLLDAAGEGEIVEILARYLNLKLDQTKIDWIRNECLSDEFLADEAVRALSYATEHENIVAVGAVLEALQQTPNSSCRPGNSAGCHALRNFVRESTRSPSTFLFLMKLIARISGNPVDESKNSSCHCAAELAGIGLQFLEICSSAPHLWQYLGEQDIVVPG